MGAGRALGKARGAGRVRAEGDAQFVKDQEALSRFRGGDDRAYGELFARYHGIAVGYARRFTNSLQDAEDLAQDAFARVLQALKRGKGPTVSMGHYLLTAVRTIATDKSRRKLPDEFLADHDLLAGLYEDRQYEDEQELADWVVEGFNSLTDRQQALVWNHAVEGRSLTSIAPDLKISIASASRDYSKAMRALRSCFASSASLSSTDFECRGFAEAIVEPRSKWGPDTRAHVSGCLHCQAVVKRLHSNDATLLSLIVVSGLGAFGVKAVHPAGAASAMASWWAGLGAPVKVAVGGLTVAATAGVVSVVVALATGVEHTDAGVLDPFGVPEADGAVIASTELCDVKRTVSGQRGEVWQLGGDPTCTATLTYFSGEARSEVRLGLDDRDSVRALDIASPGTYRLHLADASGQKTAEVWIPPAPRQKPAFR